jgi:MoaA/NifB/PqqE/SkfB family radical SAM enzyme
MPALGAPLYVGWQLTNECNLACLHCIEESGPGKALKGELSRAEALDILRRLDEAGVPYLSFSGGEPLLHPGFWDLLAAACGKDMHVKVETNGHLLSAGDCSRMREFGVKAVQVSLDGASPESYERLRVRGRFETVLSAVRMLKAAGVPVEINFSPTRFNVREIGRAVDMAFELGAVGFYTGRTIMAGNAARSRALIEPSESQYVEYFAELRGKAAVYEGRMRVCAHEAGLLEELKFRLENPAALFIILPDGKVKLINALPFLCGDLRRQSVLEVWKSFLEGWRSPEVRAFVGELERDPSLIDRLHERVGCSVA